MPYQEKDGTWRAVVKILGKRVATKRGFATSRAAVKWELEERKQIKQREQNGLALGSLTIEYMEYSKRYSSCTVTEKLALCNRILAEWGKDQPVNHITPKMCLDYLTKQKQARSANAANVDRKNILAMWSYAISYFDAQECPAAKIPKFPHDRKPQFTPVRSDVLKLKAVCKPDEWTMLLTYLHTGARKSELFRLTWEDIDFPNGKLRLWTRKTRDLSLKARWLDMTSELKTALEWWWKARPVKDTPYVFVVIDDRSPHYGKPFTMRRRFLAGLCKRAGIKEMGFHALRRHVASYMAVQNVPLQVIQNVLGHAAVSTTERYVYNIVSDQKQYMELLSTETPEEQLKKEEIKAS
ncbi:MAG: tyrosine-type recombinase/integrase [Desulfomonilia bacterium]